MIRRISHTAGLAAAMVAVALLSSCSSPSSPGSDVVASANGVELTKTVLDKLMLPPLATDPSTPAVPPTPPSADDTRKTITQWLQIAAIGHDMSTITDADSLQKEAIDASVALAAPFLGPAEEVYANGFDGSPKLCLGAVPLAAETNADEVLAAMAGGMALADAAAKYSADPAFVQSQGVLTFQDGTTCVDPANLNPDVVTQMGTAKPGEPKLVTLGNGRAVVIVRPFDTLTPREQLSISTDVQTQVANELNRQLKGADIFVDKRYGRWEADSSSVVALVVE